MTTISDGILALLDVSYEQTADEIIRHVLRRCGEAEHGGHVMNALNQLEQERWLIYSKEHGTYRRRTQAQWDALMAANNPQQGRLI